MANSKPRKLSVYLYIPNIIGGFCSIPFAIVWLFILLAESGAFVTGYVRVLMNVLAFAICFSNKKIFSVLYFIRYSIYHPYCTDYRIPVNCLETPFNFVDVFGLSFVCDGVDGWAARKFNQGNARSLLRATIK